MEPRKFTVHNQTRGTTLSSSVTTVNAALEPLKVLKVLIEGLPANSRTGLWLTNFKGVPVARTLSPFDLVYLDKGNRVVQGIELTKDGEFAPPRGQSASALVLPPKSLITSQTKAGDELEFHVLEEEVRAAATAAIQPPPVETAPVSVHQQEERQPEPSPSARFFSSSPIASPPASPENAPAQISTGAPEGAPFSARLPESASDQAAAEVSEPQDQTPAFHSPFHFPDVTLGETPKEDASATAAEPAAPAVAEPGIGPFWKKRPSVPQPPPTPVSLISISEAPMAADAEPELSAAAAPIATPQIEPPQVQEPPDRGPETPGYDYGPQPRRRYSWKIRLLRWLFPELVIRESDAPRDRRRADRQSLPGLIAYYFTGGSPEPQRISNISVTGFYLHTDERWMPGTVVRMTLQRVGSKGDDPSDTITVNSRIVRWGSDGEGFEFILSDPEE